MGLPTPFNPYNPIPNNPFYSAQSYYVQGVQGPLVIGAGLSVNYASSTLSASGGGGGGAVSQIIAGTGITISPTGGTGNVIVNNAGVLSIAAGTGISVSAIGGNYTINATGGTGTVTSVSAGTGLLGGPITTAGALTLNFACVVDPTDFTAKGAILAGTGPSTYSALPVGANGLVLTACSTAANGVCWASASANDIPLSAITAKGTLITGTAASTPFSLPVGTNGQVLVACSTAGSGLCWTANTASITPATPTDDGAVFGLTDNATTYNTALGACALNTTAVGAANVIVGASAGSLITSGSTNVGVGGGALCTLTTGGGNIGVGFLSLSTITTGGNNIALGTNAGAGLTGTETGNVIIGGNFGTAGVDNHIILADGSGTLRVMINDDGALSPDGINFGTAGQVLCSGGPGSTWGWTSAGATTDATSLVAGTLKGCTNNTLCNTFYGCCAGPGVLSTGACNTALGYQAGAAISNGNVNTIVGYAAGCAITSGSWNVLIAHNAGDSITSGGCNIAIGGAAGASITTACENVLIGDLAGTSTTGGQNVGVGTQALRFTTGGTGNTALGLYAGCNITTGTNNIAIGACALGRVSAGVTSSCNIAIGFQTAANITTGGANIIIGAGSAASTTTQGCNVSIGSQNNSGFNYVTMLGNGFTANAACQVWVGTAGTSATYACFAQGAGGWSFPSDQRRKEEIKDLEGNLALVEKLQPRTFLVKGATEDDEKTPSFGLVAQEVAAAIEGTALEGRGLVNGNEEDGYGVTYASLVSVLIGAVKELSAEVKALKGE